MKNLILPFILAAFALSSCTTLYKSGQTPDDVYYSPVNERPASPRNYVQSEDYYQPYTNYEDMRIRMNAYDPRWRQLDSYYNYDYSYNPYTYGYNYGYYYNPYYYNYPVYIKGVTILNPRNNAARTTNLGSYKNSGVNVVNSNGYNNSSRTFQGYNNTNRSYNNTNSSQYNKTYNESGNNNSRSSNVERTYNPTSSSPSSSPSSSGSGSVQRNTRGN